MGTHLSTKQEKAHPQVRSHNQNARAFNHNEGLMQYQKMGTPAQSFGYDESEKSFLKRGGLVTVTHNRAYRGENSSVFNKKRRATNIEKNIHALNVGNPSAGSQY